MQELFVGVWNRFNTVNNLNTALSNNLYPHEAPQDVSFPYGLQIKIFGDSDYDFTDLRDDQNWQFSLFSDENPPDEINTLYGYLKDLFDDAPILVAGYRVLRFQRLDDVLLRDEVQGTWAYHIDYSVWLEKDRP